MNTLPSIAEMTRATLSRDGSYDGLFYACVTSTRIFCRPSCPARKPHAGNIVFRASVRECLLDGYRPCKRCRPLNVNGAAPDGLERLLDRVEQTPCDRLTDADLRGLGMSPFRVRRYFKRHFGMTFQAYHRNRRMGLALEQLRHGADSLSVGFDAGFESASGFRDAFERVFGTTPGQCSQLTCIKTARLETPLGAVVAGANDDGVCLLEFADRRAFARQVASLCRRMRAVVVPGSHHHLDQLAVELNEYFDGHRRSFEVPLVTPGSTFQCRVWAALRAIPYGRSVTYLDLARAIGSNGSQRAVGRANGENRIAIVIPCHRVIRSDGSLCGYGGGVWRKRRLLDLEQTHGASSATANSIPFGDTEPRHLLSPQRGLAVGMRPA